MQIDYSTKTDEELILLSREGDRSASDFLINRHKFLVRNVAKSMFILGAEPEDTIQEGMIGLFKAIRDYDSAKEAGFVTFANLCIKRQILTAIESAGRKKNSPLNSYISIYEDEGSNGDSSRELLDEYVDGSTMNPEQVLIDKENIEILTREIEKSLSDFEQQVYERHLMGMGYIEIAKDLGREEKACDNALQRVKSKIRGIVKN